VYVFNHHYFAIGGSDEQIFVSKQIAVRTAEKLQQQQKRYGRCPYKYEVEGFVATIKPKQQQINGQQSQQRKE
jgi:hypothetical protein